MNVTLVGDGPAASAVAAAVADTPASVARGEVEAVASADLGVVVGTTGESTFERANAIARQAGVPWVAVEVGGVGGRAVDDVRASVAGFAPATGCYDCLRTRVAANADEDDAADASANAADARLAGAVAGREAVRLLSGEESPVLGGVIELPHEVRQFLPVPGCPTCGDAPDRTLELSSHERGLEEALTAAEGALDPRVGVVGEVGEAESFPAPYYLARVADTTGFSDVEAAPQAAGVDADWNAAFMKALGEGMERYCAGVYRAEQFRLDRPSDVDGAVPPSRFVGAEDTDEAIPWVVGRDLAAAVGAVDTADVWLPAELVRFPPPEHRLGSSITTGLGLGNSSVEAVLSGLYEVIERDATMLAWYSTFDPLGLAVDDEGFDALVGRARCVGLEVTPLLVTQDVDVPVVTVAVHREGEWPRFAVGSGADLDPAAAARSALAEALQNWMELRGMGPDEAADESGAIGRYADFPGSTREMVAVDGRVPAESVGPDEVPTGETELRAVVERVADAGLTPYAARTTTRDVASLGFEAVRVLVPGAQPLFTDDSTFGERAGAVPAELGFDPWLDREHHPYP
ncbi:bacteriocin biosynthesis protein SagD [Halobacteriales archaeon QS_1_68_20]|nr:MAG: bacteriocin biosynthesis protein SagD [Halobacteriales archaeon QS_1_68_20]